MKQPKKLTGLALLVLGAVLASANLVKAEPGAVFFPPGLFSEQGDADKVNQSWYAKQLTALKEASIYELRKDSQTTVFRFLCIRTFQPPFVIRVEKKADGGGSLFFKQSDGQGGYQTGKVAENQTVKLSKAQMSELEAKFNSGFFEMKNRGKNRGGLEGSRWLIEGLQNGKYHLVDRYSPGWGSFRNLGMNLIKLSGEDLKDLD